MPLPQAGELAVGGVPVAVTCRVLEMPRSAVDAWVRGGSSQRDWHDRHLTNTMTATPVMTRRSYPAPRVHAELPRGLGVRVSPTSVARSTRQAHVVGISHRRKRGARMPRLPAPYQGLAQRGFVVVPLD